jgi:hypothetical protein
MRSPPRIGTLASPAMRHIGCVLLRVQPIMLRAGCGALAIWLVVLVTSPAIALSGSAIARVERSRAWPSALGRISCASASLCVATALRSGQVVVSRHPSAGAAAWRTLTIEHSIGPTWRDLACRVARTHSICLARDLVADRLVFSNDPARGSRAWKIGGRALSGIGGYYPSVSCPSISLCLVNSGDGVYLSNRPAGGERYWRGTVFPARSASQVGILSCPNASFCAALQLNLDGLWTTIHPAGAAAGWKLRSVHPISFDGRPGTLSCASRRLCAAIGTLNASAPGVIVSTDPTGGRRAWRYTPIQGTAPGEQPIAVSCPSRSLCVALTAAEGVDAGLVTSTRPSGGASAWKLTRLADSAITLYGLSCPSVSFCAAVGALDGKGVVLTTYDPAAGASAWRTTVL